MLDRMILKTGLGLSLPMFLFTLWPSAVPAAARARHGSASTPTVLAAEDPDADGAIAMLAIPIEFDPLVDLMVAEVEQEEYVATWQALDDYGTRYTFTDQNEAASQWIHDLFASYGLEAVFHTYEQSGQRRNVIGVLPGLIEPERILYMTGHFDSNSDNPYSDAPGADDNASGVAAILQAARIMSQYRFHYTIKFAGFNGEEQSMVGSSAYVADIAEQEEDVVGCFNIDMIAHTADELPIPDLIIYTDSASVSLALMLEDAVNRYVGGEVEPVVIEERMTRSDHYSFWHHGYKAVLAIEDSVDGDNLSPWYHSNEDKIENYPQDFPTYVTMALIAAVAQTAIPVEPEEPHLLISARAIDDDSAGSSQGNGNGTIERGERIELTLTLRNVGLQDAPAVVGQLLTTDDNVTVTVSQASFGTIPGKRETASNSEPLVFEISPLVPNKAPLHFRLALNDPADTLALTLWASAADLSFAACTVDDETGGDGDGIPEPGEEVELTITIGNQGDAAVGDVAGMLSAGSAFLQAASITRSFGTLGPEETSSTSPFTIAIDPECPPQLRATLSLTLEGAGSYAQTFSIPFHVGYAYVDDMESGEAGWIHYSASTGYYDEWHIESSRNHTDGGSASWKCGANGTADYGSVLHAVLETPAFDLPPFAHLTLWHRMDAEQASQEGCCFDGGLVEISINGGSWKCIAPNGGYPYRILESEAEAGPFPEGTRVFSGFHDWQQVSFDLSGHAGDARLRFVFGSDEPMTAEGWYLDDMEITAAPEGSGVRLVFHTPRPNPLRTEAALFLDLSQEAQVNVRLYDVAGRLIRTLRDESLPSGRHVIDWDGRDASNVRVASGVYFIEAGAGSERQSVRMVVVR